MIFCCCLLICSPYLNDLTVIWMLLLLSRYWQAQIAFYYIDTFNSECRVLRCKRGINNATATKLISAATMATAAVSTTVPTTDAATKEEFEDVCSFGVGYSSCNRPLWLYWHVSVSFNEKS